MATFTISLNNVRFFAHHGLYTEETLMGNEFEVNLQLTIEAGGEGKVDIEDTINYVAVYELLKEMFAIPEKLLESLAVKIATALKARFPALKGLQLTITKLHPPIVQFNGSVSVTYQKNYS